MGVTHRDSEAVITELSEALSVKMFGSEFPDLTDDQQAEVWEQASQDYYSRQIDYAKDLIPEIDIPAGRDVG